MTRIPAALIDADQPTSGGATASRRVVKAHNLDVGQDSILISPPSLTATRAAAHVAPSIAPAAPSAAPVVDSSDHSADELKQALAAAERNFERRLADEVARAQQAGYDQGYAEGGAAASAQVNAQNERLEAAAAGFNRAWEGLAEHSEPLLVELAFRMAEAILEAPLPEGIRTLSTSALTESIEKLGASGAVQITLHPADYMMLDESGILVPLLRNHPNLNWLTDAKLERGDWEARSEGAVVRRVGQELLQDHRERLSGLDGGGV